MSIVVDITVAEERLEELIDAALRGENVLSSENGALVVRLVPVDVSDSSTGTA